MLIIDTVENKADYLRIGKLKLADDVDKLFFLCRAGADDYNSAVGILRDDRRIDNCRNGRSVNEYIVISLFERLHELGKGLAAQKLTGVGRKIAREYDIEIVIVYSDYGIFKSTGVDKHIRKTGRRLARKKPVDIRAAQVAVYKQDFYIGLGKGYRGVEHIYALAVAHAAACEFDDLAALAGHRENDVASQGVVCFVDDEAGVVAEDIFTLGRRMVAAYFILSSDKLHLDAPPFFEKKPFFLSPLSS